MAWLFLGLMLLAVGLLWFQTIVLAQINKRQKILVSAAYAAPLKQSSSIPYEITEIITQLRLIESSATQLAGAIKSETAYAVADAVKQLGLIEGNTSRLLGAIIDLEATLSANDIRSR
jgi:hypothetical protein